MGKENPQNQKCDLCGGTGHCIGVSITTAGVPGLVSVGPSYWVCMVCSHTPIGELIRMAFDTRDGRPTGGAG